MNYKILPIGVTSYLVSCCWIFVFSEHASAVLIGIRPDFGEWLWLVYTNHVNSWKLVQASISFPSQAAYCSLLVGAIEEIIYAKHPCIGLGCMGWWGEGACRSWLVWLTVLICLTICLCWWSSSYIGLMYNHCHSKPELVFLSVSAIWSVWRLVSGFCFCPSFLTVHPSVCLSSNPLLTSTERY